MSSTLRFVVWCACRDGRGAKAFARAMYRVRVEQNARAWPRAQHGGEPLPARHDAAVGDGAVLRFDRQLTLAPVHIRADDLHGGWPPGMRPVGRRRARGSWWSSACHHVNVEAQPPLHTNYPELLIANKRAAGRPKDLADVAALEAQETR